MTKARKSGTGAMRNGRNLFCGRTFPLADDEVERLQSVGRHKGMRQMEVFDVAGRLTNSHEETMNGSTVARTLRQAICLA